MEKTDKEFMVRRIIRNLLECAGYKPKEAVRILEELLGTGKEALALSGS